MKSSLSIFLSKEFIKSGFMINKIYAATEVILSWSREITPDRLPESISKIYPSLKVKIFLFIYSEFYGFYLSFSFFISSNRYIFFR